MDIVQFLIIISISMAMLGFFLATENVSRRVVTLWNKISKFSDTLKWMEKVYQKMDNLPAPIAHIIYLF
jgi:hypothetical protein